MTIAKTACFFALIPLAALNANSAQAQQQKDTFPVNISSVAVSASAGGVYSPAPFDTYNISLPNYQSISAAILLRRSKLTLRDSIFGMPSYGIGVYRPNLHETRLFGTPFSIYGVYSATLAGIGRKVSLGYEGKIGASFGWKPYSYTSNPFNKALGSKINYHAEADLFLNIRLFKPVASKVGIAYTHFSDGSYKLPNGGLNLLGIYGEISYDFDYRSVKPFSISPNLRKQQSHYELDVEAKISHREVKQSAVNSSKLGNIDHSFRSYSISSFLMLTQSVHARVGLGLQLYYDESCNILAYRPIDSTSDKSVYRYLPSDVKDRFGVGMYGRLDIPMGYINAMVDLGYLFDNGAFNSDVLVINLSVKSYIYRSTYLSFGVQTIPVNRSVSTILGLGYSFGQKKYRLSKHN